MLQNSHFVVKTAICIAISTLQRSLGKEMGYTPKFLIDNVSPKLPCRAFSILRKSSEMIMNPDVDVYQTAPDNNRILLNEPVVPKLFRA